jgi:hypothetical protein
LKVFRTYLTLQLTGVFRVAGEEEDLVIFREGSDGLDGGGMRLSMRSRSASRKRRSFSTDGRATR